MINILICDDDLQFTTQLKDSISNCVSSLKIQARIHAYNSAEEIGSEVFSSCDVAFLDIDFAQKNYNGLDIAKKLRTLGNDAVIIFITNYLEYAPAGYEVRAFRYILKNELPQKLNQSILELLTYIREAKSDIKLQVNGEIISVMLREILYVEAMGHTVIYHLISKTPSSDHKYICYTTLADTERELKERGFLRIHKSFLVNMMYIKKLSSNTVLLQNKFELPVGNKYRAECKNKFLLWKGLQ